MFVVGVVLYQKTVFIVGKIPVCVIVNAEDCNEEKENRNVNKAEN